MADGMASLSFHPYADLFPLMEGEEFNALVDDLIANGLQQPIVMLGPMILDGRNRYRACVEAGIVAAYIDYTGSDPLGYVVSANLQRRHLNESQRAMVADKLATMPQGRPDKGANLHHIPTRDAAAQTLGVSRRSIASARIVRESAIPEIAHRVETGEVAVSLAEKVAKLPKQQQQALATASESELRGAAKKHERSEREIALADKTMAAATKLGDRLYSVIYADPPWRFEPYSRDTGMDRAADNHYPTVTVHELLTMKVPAAPDCVLFLWATVPMLCQALGVMGNWGFTYKSHFIWLKDRMGTGYWNRNQHELLLVGTRGDIPAPAPGTQYPSVIDAPVTGHSAKPHHFAEMIEELFPNQMLLEMFARGPRLGWTVHGNETD